MGILSLFLSAPKYRSGVYRISNKRNGKAYIGSTRRRMYDRWIEHRESLDEGTHHNSALQEDWDYYGGDAFRFTVLEVVEDINLVLHRELHWQQTTQNLYTKQHARPVKRHIEDTPKVSRYDQTVQLAQKLNDVGDWLYSANAIYGTVRGNRNEVMRWIREVRA